MLRNFSGLIESLSAKADFLSLGSEHVSDQLLALLSRYESLEIGCHRNPFSVAIALMPIPFVVKLKRARLCGRIDHFVLAVERLQQLKSLNLFGIPQLEFAHISEIKANLHNKEMEMVNTVEARRKAIPLEVLLNRHYTNVSVPENLTS